MTTDPYVNFSNTYDTKPSATFERLQMLLEDKHHSENSYRRNSLENSNTHLWSSTRQTSDKTFTCNDAEQLLSYVQHLRH